MNISLPLDSDGFLRRECPHCAREFKWHNGPANEEADSQPDPPAYHCPLCGKPAQHDSWFTQQQQNYIEETVAPAATRAAQDELATAFRKNKHVTFKPDTSDIPTPPAPLTEPDDMRIVTSPCHAYEPFKVPDNTPETLHCLVCGTAFRV